ncbi:MAG: hypothetical protein R6X18_10910 [Chloroflexota bacterium]
MLKQPVQSTVFIVDVVDINTHPWPFNSIQPIINGNRIRVRERYTIIVPDNWNGDLHDDCEASATQSVLQLHLAQAITREVELEYELIGPGSITINCDRIHFQDAGLRILTRACGPAYVLKDRCRLRSQMIVSAISNYLNALGRRDEEERLSTDSERQSNEKQTDFTEMGPDEEQIRYWLEYLRAVWNEECFNELFEESVEAVNDPRRRVYYFHADTHLQKPALGAATGVALQTDVFRGAYPMPQSEQPIDLNDLNGFNLYPLIWYPFTEEAFAFAAVISADRFKLLGRMGGLTRGYRITDDLHWQVNIDEFRPLTFAEDIMPGPTTIEKFAEFDAGPLPPGDFDIGLDPDDIIHLWLEPVPFYIGAMPISDPTQFQHSDLTDLHQTQTFRFLEGELDTPIFFDPVVNCGSCPS